MVEVDEEGKEVDPKNCDASPLTIDISDAGSASDIVAFVMTTDIPRG